MAFIDAPGGRRRDAALNLVPYVDVLMTLMAFLVACAAWTQLAVLDARVGGASTSAAPVARSASADDPWIAVSVQRLLLHTSAAADGTALADVRALRFALDAERARGASALRVVVDDGVNSARVVAVVDAARGAGFSAPAVEPSTDRPRPANDGRISRGRPSVPRQSQ